MWVNTRYSCNNTYIKILNTDVSTLVLGSLQYKNVDSHP